MKFLFWSLLPVEEGEAFLDTVRFGGLVPLIYLMLLVTWFSYNCNLFQHFFFLFVFLNSFVHLHVTLMVRFLLRTIKCYPNTLLTDDCALQRDLAILLMTNQHTHTRTNTHTQTYILTHTHTNTYTHTQTHTKSLWPIVLAISIY